MGDVLVFSEWRWKNLETSGQTLSQLHDWYAGRSFANQIWVFCLGFQFFECYKTFDHQWILANFGSHFYNWQDSPCLIAQKAVGPPSEISKGLAP